jgi:hypothetical protein
VILLTVSLVFSTVKLIFSGNTGGHSGAEVTAILSRAEWFLDRIRLKAQQDTGQSANHPSRLQAKRNSEQQSLFGGHFGPMNKFRASTLKDRH